MNDVQSILEKQHIAFSYVRHQFHKQLYEKYKSGQSSLEDLLIFFEEDYYTPDFKIMHSFELSQFSVSFLEKRLFDEHEIMQIIDIWNRKELIPSILQDHQTIDRLLRQNVLTDKHIEFLVESLKNSIQLKNLLSNTSIFERVVSKKLLTQDDFKNVAYIFQNQDELHELFDLQFLKKLLSNNLVQKDWLNNLVNCIDTTFEQQQVIENLETLVWLIQNNSSSFKEIFQIFTAINQTNVSKQFSDNVSKLFSDEVFEQLYNANCISENDLRFIHKAMYEHQAVFQIVCSYSVVLKKLFEFRIVNESEFQFDEFVTRLSDKKSLHHVLINDNLFDELFSNNLISHSELQKMLSKVSSYMEVDGLSKNQVLLKYILSNLLIDESLLKNFNRLLSLSKKLAIENQKNTVFENIFFDSTYSKYTDSALVENFFVGYKKMNQQQIDELLSYIQLNALFVENAFFKSLSNEEKKELIEVCETNVEVQNKLQVVVDNNLEITFESFEELMRYLTKVDKKLRIAL